MQYRWPILFKAPSCTLFRGEDDKTLRIDEYISIAEYIALLRNGIGGHTIEPKMRDVTTAPNVKTPPTPLFRGECKKS